MEELEVAYEINSLLKVGQSYCEFNLGSEEVCAILHLLTIIIEKNEHLTNLLDVR